MSTPEELESEADYERAIEMSEIQRWDKPDPRFWVKVDVRDGDACWLWTGATTTHGGYGLLRRMGKEYRAHRVMWEMVEGPIPQGMFVCHACDTPPCVNPRHLFLGDARANNLDRETKRRGFNSRRDECAKGHPFSEENTKRDSKGRRVCIECQKHRRREGMRSWRKRRAAAKASA